jgi:hypothetical protein
MSIRFNCPHCKKEFNVKDHLAGKRSPCPECKKPLTIPAPVSKPANIEDLAAAAFADPPPAPAAAPTTTIEFTCYYCDEKVQVNSDLAGKQTPCPSCRRIIKVPLSEKTGPTDWRKAETRLPAGARRDTEPAPEGTWGTANATAVSREALVEAEAIPETRERWTWQQWTKVGTAAVVFLGVVGLGAWLTLRYINQNRQAGAYDRVVQYLDTPGKVSSEDAGALQRWVGEYELRARQPVEAKNRFQKAREALSGAKNLGQTLQDVMLIEIALSQIDLGGEQPAVKEGTHLKWEDAQREVAQTLQALHTAEGRAAGMREVSRKLIEKGLAARVGPMASRFPEAEVPELRAIVGLELIRGKSDPKRQQLAEELETQAQQRFAKPAPAAKPPEGKASGPVPPASLIALWLALGKQDKVPALPSPAGGQNELVLPILLGWIEGHARHGDQAIARSLLRQVREPRTRLLSLLALSAAVCDNDQAQTARSDLEEAYGLAADPKVAQTLTPWTWLRLARLGLQAGIEDKKVQALAAAIPDAALRSWVQLEVVRHQLVSTKEPAEETLAQPVGKDTYAYKLALEAITRHQTRYGGGTGMLKTAEGWEPEPLRPFGYIGVALGLQEINP